MNLGEILKGVKKTLYTGLLASSLALGALTATGCKEYSDISHDGKQVAITYGEEDEAILYSIDLIL